MSLDNVNFATQSVEGLSSNGEIIGGHFNNLKRRRTDEDISELSLYTSSHIQPSYTPQPPTYPLGKTFLMVRHNSFIYHTEDWKPRGCTMYLPLEEDIMINTRNVEQISFEMDQFFLADDKGNYVGAKPGHALHLWRFDHSTRKLYISRSILFLRDVDYRELQNQLENL